MKMRAIDSLALPAGKTVELRPGGYHVMLMDLAQPLKEGDSVPVMLTFADKSGRRTTQEVKATVRALTRRKRECLVIDRNARSCKRGAGEHFMQRLLRAALSAPVLVTTIGTAHASCGSAFCNVNTNWSLQGVWTQPGPHVDVRFEYIDQDQPMSGSNKVSVGQVPAHHDEVETINRNVITTLDYGFNENWGITAVIPIVDRSHEHIHNHRGEKLLESWSFTQLGDIRVQGRYQTYFGEVTAERAGFAGATFGLVLPTGATDITNGDGTRG